MVGMATYVLFMVHTDNTDTTLIFYSIEVQTYFPPEQKTDTTAQLEMNKGSSSPRKASVFISPSVCLSVCLAVQKG